MSQESPSHNVFARKLSNAASLETGDLDRLHRLLGNPRTIPAKTDLIRHGDPPDYVHLILEGVACRYKLTQDGRRAIMALLLPGDFCDLHVAIPGRMDHSICTLSESQVVFIRHREIEEVLENYPRLARALWWATLVDEAVLREWLVNMGRRRSDRQMAHLICEIHCRLENVGRLDDFRVPLTLQQMADALGITPVHAQRVAAALADVGLLAQRDRVITVPDIDRLKEFAEFDDDYLHLNQREDRPSGGREKGT